jgi:NADH-quinone oxidoreductase subunit N
VNETAATLLRVFPLIVPECVLLLGVCVLFLGATFRSGRHFWGLGALLFLAAAGVALWYGPQSPNEETPARSALFAAPLYVDGFAMLVRAIAYVGAAVLVLAAWDEVQDHHAAEFHACLLSIAAGVGLVGAANDLVILFLALELISIPTYVLLYLQRTDNAAQEAAMKYFLLSIFSSGLLLFGFSYLYGLCGTTNLSGIADALGRDRHDAMPGVALVALVLVVAGLAFRITAVPFHFYAPDVYQGTTPSAAAILAFVPKVAGFVGLLRVLGFVPHALTGADGAATLFEGTGVPEQVLGGQVPRLLWILAVVTMSLGNVLALWQDNVRRMLAYSSVAHAGYMLIGLVVARFLPAGSSLTDPGGVEAVLFYLVAYGAMTVGAFAVLACLGSPTRPVETVDDLAGLGKSHPRLALLMTLFLFSMIGMPLTAGFAGKMLLFWGAMSVRPDTTDPLWFRVLALVGAINAAIGAWYYLRLITVMYLRPAVRPLPPTNAWAGVTAVVLCAALTLAAGVYPPALLRPINRALPHAPTPPPGQAMR